MALHLVIEEGPTPSSPVLRRPAENNAVSLELLELQGQTEQTSPLADGALHLLVQDARQLGKRCLPICQSHPNQEARDHRRRLVKLLTRVQSLP